MSLISWDEFLPAVQPSVPLCPDPVVIKAIRDSAIQWCQDTRCWQEILDPIPIGGGQGNYLIPGDANKLAACVMTARVDNGNDLEIVTPDRADELYPRWREDQETGQPEVLTQLHPRDFWIVPYPVSDGFLTLSVAWRPKKGCAKTDELLFEEYEEGIAVGAIARLKAILDKPWTNLSEAKAAGEAFVAATLLIRSRVGKGFGRAVNRVRGHYF
jgi:hypothetical protein